MKIKQKMLTVKENGDIYTYKGILHNLSQPSIRRENGDEMWYKDGILHREKGPASTVSRRDGKCYFWYKEGKYHRVGGPACITPTVKCWYIDGKLHRTDGPAVIRSNGNKEWHINGVLVKTQ
jgi:hypothetical protein